MHISVGIIKTKRDIFTFSVLQPSPQGEGPCVDDDKGMFVLLCCASLNVC